MTVINKPAARLLVKSKTRSFCMFCGDDHSKKRRPEDCSIKGKVVQAYLKAGVEMWQILAGIKMGVLDLDREVKRYRNLVKIQKEKTNVKGK